MQRNEENGRRLELTSVTISLQWLDIFIKETDYETMGPFLPARGHAPTGRRSLTLLNVVCFSSPLFSCLHLQKDMNNS